MKKSDIKSYSIDLLVAVLAGFIVSVAYYFFQNSNGFAPGGVYKLLNYILKIMEGIRWIICPNCNYIVD